MRFSSRWVLPVFFGICAVGARMASALVIRFGDAGSDLQAVYVQGFSKTFLGVAYFFIACAAASLVYAHSPAFRRMLARAQGYIAEYSEASVARYALLSFFSAAAILFILNAPGILTGTFLIDDYGMYAVATQKTALQLFWTPINDHVIPLFWLELKTLFTIAGTHSPLLNLPLLAAAAVAIGAAGILLYQLGFGMGALAAFLAIFASTTVVSHQMYGFYAVAPYFQVLALFMLSLVCFVQARRTQSMPYLTASIALVAASVFLESGGIWTPCALALFAIAYRINTGDSPRKEVVVCIAAALITAAYVAYLIAIPHFSQEPFYGPNHLPVSPATVYELYKVITAGVLSSYFIPRMGLVMSQPRFEHMQALWHIAMFALFAIASAGVWWALVRASRRARIWGAYFILLCLGTSLLVAIARPSSHAVSFYRDQNLLFPLFFVSLAFVIIGYEWIRAAQNERSMASRRTIVAALCTLVFASQLIFSFYKAQYLDDISFNRALTSRMSATLVPALNGLSAVHAPLSVPALGGTFLGSSSYQLPDLSKFSVFLGIQHVMWVPPGRNAATSSPVFADALRHDERLRAWYLVPGEIGETCRAEAFGSTARAITAGAPIIAARTVDATRTSRLAFDITARNAPEKIFISVGFENDFAATGTLAVIRLDQYTPRVQGDARRYACAINLNDIPAYALSQTVHNFSLTIETPGGYSINAMRFFQNGETLPSGMQ